MKQNRKLSCWAGYICLSILAVSAGCSSPSPINHAPANLIVNPSFTQGLVGFQSDYALRSDGAGTYVLGLNPAAHHKNARNYPDHTEGSGLMLIANGSTEPNMALWSQTITVKPNTQYKFSGWTASWSAKSRNPARLVFMINGVQAGKPFDIQPQHPGNWTRFSIQWESGPANSAIIRIENQILEPLGNDITLDDLSFTVIP